MFYLLATCLGSALTPYWSGHVSIEYLEELEIFPVSTTWRIIPVSKWLVAPIYKPFRPFGRGITPVRGLTNHGYPLLTKWDDPPSSPMAKQKKTSSITQKCASLHPLLFLCWDLFFWAHSLRQELKEKTHLPGREYNSPGKCHPKCFQAPPENNGAALPSSGTVGDPIWKCLLRWMLNIPLFGEICIFTGCSILAGWCSNPHLVAHLLVI